MAGEVVVGATTTMAIHDGRANRVGSFRTQGVGSRKMLASDGLKLFGGRYAKRPRKIYKAPEGTHTATETTGHRQSAGIHENSRRL